MLFTGRPTRFRHGGFNLIELLMVLTIVLIIVALLLPAYRAIRTRTEAARCAANLRQLHAATMLFRADHHFYPIGYSDDLQPAPGRRWSQIRRPLGLSGIYTQWQIEIAPYLGDGLVEQANWILYPNHARMDARVAWDAQGSDPSAWRLPMEFRCPGYNRLCSDAKYDWRHASGDVRKDHYGYCYNQYVMVGNGKPEAPYTVGPEQHKGRDPSIIVTGYAPPNGPAHTLLLFCSRWGVWQSKVGTFGSDLSGVYAGEPDFPGYPATNPHGAAGFYCGVAAGIHGGVDNFLFLDGHVERLNRGDPADRRRMNKTWWRALPLDASCGHYGWNNAADYQPAYWFDSGGRPAGHVSTNGKIMAWWPSAPPAPYNWDY